MGKIGRRAVIPLQQYSPVLQRFCRFCADQLCACQRADGNNNGKASTDTQKDLCYAKCERKIQQTAGKSGNCQQNAADQSGERREIQVFPSNHAT